MNRGPRFSTSNAHYPTLSPNAAAEKTGALARRGVARVRVEEGQKSGEFRWGLAATEMTPVIFVQRPLPRFQAPAAAVCGAGAGRSRVLAAGPVVRTAAAEAGPVLPAGRCIFPRIWPATASCASVEGTLAVRG